MTLKSVRRGMLSLVAAMGLVGLVGCGEEERPNGVSNAVEAAAEATESEETTAPAVTDIESVDIPVQGEDSTFLLALDQACSDIEKQAEALDQLLGDASSEIPSDVELAQNTAVGTANDLISVAPPFVSPGLEKAYEAFLLSFRQDAQAVELAAEDTLSGNSDNYSKWDGLTTQASAAREAFNEAVPEANACAD